MPIVIARVSIDHTICLRPLRTDSIPVSSSCLSGLSAPNQNLENRQDVWRRNRLSGKPNTSQQARVGYNYKLSAKKKETNNHAPKCVFPLFLLGFCSLFSSAVHDEVGCYIHASHIQSLQCRSKYWSSRRDHQPRQLLSDEGEKTKPISQVNDQRPIDPRPWAQEAFPKQREGATTRSVCALTSNAARREGGC